MYRRQQLKNLAYGIACRFASRNNDIDGYWALGLLYSAADAAATHTVRFDLVSETAAPSFKYSTKVLTQFGQYLQDRLAKLDLEGYVFAATIDIEFNIEPQPNHAMCRTTWGDPFRCCVTLTDDLGRDYTGTIRGWCGKHDTTRERRSTRGYAS
ncbi:MAG: hypothetical protein JWN70_3416 [Planctomycetaceae bacterium]|nr:hypothetical protein [Planctomycetaceae bacterium]